jgi:DNA-binding transcriptional regulator GbsR (MarR family)
LKARDNYEESVDSMIAIKHLNPQSLVSKNIETSPMESSVMDMCVRLCSLLGLPKSVGLIYGAVFVSPKPIEAGQICKKLKISRGSTSQGLRFLKELGAIRSSGLSGNRAEHFEAEEHLRLALENFILKKISPALKEIGQEIEKLEKIAPELDQHVLAEKLDALKRWHKHGKLLLPIVTGFLKTMPLLARK